VAVTACGFREALAMLGFGVAHLVALRCVPLLVVTCACRFMLPLLAAFSGRLRPPPCS
jgi:hypothetical protein